MLRYIEMTLQYFIIGYNRLKGVTIENTCLVYYSCHFSKGYLNGRKGQISIAAHCELCQGVVR